MQIKKMLDHLEKERSKFESIEKSAEERIRKAPEGTVCVNRHGKGVQFYIRHDPKDRNGRYLPAAEREKALALIQKKYDRQIASAAGKQAELLDHFIRNYNPDCLKKIYESMSDVRKRSIIPVELPDHVYAERWQSMPFQPKEISSDVPEHFSNKGERVRSKSEVMIADALAQAEIPYRYECPLSLEAGVVLHPDFTILRIPDRKLLYWEHLGMMDDPDYVIKNLKRIRFYEQNGIMPGIQLILTMETSQQPLNLSVIKQMIGTYCM